MFFLKKNKNNPIVDRHIRLYDTLTWHLVKDIVAQDVGWSIISVDYSPDDNWVIYSSWSPYVHLYNTKGPAVYRALDYRPSSSRFCLFSSEFSPLSTEILSGASDHCVYLYDLERNERTHRVGLLLCYVFISCCCCCCVIK